MAGAERKMLEKVTTTARELETLPRLQARARSARGSSSAQSPGTRKAREVFQSRPELTQVADATDGP